MTFPATTVPLPSLHGSPLSSSLFASHAWAAGWMLQELVKPEAEDEKHDPVKFERDVKVAQLVRGREVASSLLEGGELAQLMRGREGGPADE